MTTLPAPSPRKESEYVAARVRELYLAFPPVLCWILVPILAGIVGFVAASDLRFPIPLYVGGAAVIVGLLLGRALARRVPAWNDARRERYVLKADAEFHDLFDAFTKSVERFVEDVQLLREVTTTKSYGRYVERAKVVERSREKLEREVSRERFYDNSPTGVIEATESAQQLIETVEADPNAITAYEPQLLSKIEHFRLRAAALNTVDCYQASRQLEPLLERLARRHTPFTFASTVQRLQGQVQEYRDHLLADPLRAKLWSDLHEKAERLAEEQRHNEAMEEAAEAQAEAAREEASLAKERNEILRQRRNAERVTAAGAVTAAYYTRKSANATDKIARKLNSSSET